MSPVKIAIRQLLKNPGFAAVVVGTLALGTGANTAIFSLINEHLLRPRPVKDPSELLGVVLSDPAGDGATQRVPYPIFQDFVEHTGTQVFSRLLGYATVFAPVEANGNAGVGLVQLASADFFGELGVVPTVGRNFQADDDRQAGQAPVAVISHPAWVKWFHSDPAIVGKTIYIRPSYVEPLTCAIVGVAPIGFTGLDERAPDLWMPAIMAEHFRRATSVNFRMVGRLAPGVARRPAKLRLEQVARLLAEHHRGQPLPGYGNEGIFRSDLKVELRPAALGTWGAFKPRAVLNRASGLALAIGGLVLLIACANIANLLLVRATRRRKEIAIRFALGASRWQLLRQMLTESLILSVLGGVVGLFVGYWINQALVAARPPGLELVVPASLDGRVVGFALLIAILAGLVFGTAPVWQNLRTDPNTILKDPDSSRPGRWLTLRDAFVVGQIGLCLLLLIAAGLCGRSLMGLRSIDPGFRTREVLLLPMAGGIRSEAIDSFYRELNQRVIALPGIRSVTFERSPPFSGGGSSFPAGQIEGYAPRQNEFVDLSFTDVGPDYFETLGIPILYNPVRRLRPEETMVWVNESFVRRYWPGMSLSTASGRRVGPFVVHGVVGDSQIRNLTDPPGPYLYRQTSQPRVGSFVLMIRTAGDASSYATVVRAELQRGPGQWDLARVQTLRQALNQSLVQHRFLLELMGAFAVTATILAALGIYGVMSYVVAQRTREVGVRMALGARPADVIALILRRGLRLAGIGIAMGVAAAVGTTRVLAGAIHGISPTDPLTFVAISFFLGLIAILACWLPARRAAGIDPMAALRNE